MNNTVEKMAEANKVTPKQRMYIDAIEGLLDRRFTGETKAEASRFIDENLDAYIEEYERVNASMGDTWAIVNGYE